MLSNFVVAWDRSILSRLARVVATEDFPFAGTALLLTFITSRRFCSHWHQPAVLSCFHTSLLSPSHMISWMLILLLVPPNPALPLPRSLRSPTLVLPPPLECECELPGAGLTEALCCIMGAGARCPGFWWWWCGGGGWKGGRECCGPVDGGAWT